MKRQTASPIIQADFTTYRRADGNPVAGEYAFVTQTEWFDSEVDWEPVTFVEERYALVGSRTLTVYPYPMLCRDCEGEGEFAGGPCERCEGSGGDPLAGQTVEGEAL